MGFPKQIKPNIDLVPPKILSERRRELLEYIQKDGTYLPKSVLHADLDRGMLDFVKDSLKLVVEGKTVPVIDKIITTQNWSQFTETWNFKDPDFNTNPPFITTVRNPEVKYGTNPSTQYTIPNRKQFYYATVPTWNGNVKGYDVYTIPQPVPVDIKYSVKIICNRMRELNTFNKNVMQTFSSRQAYTFIKGQYVPIIMDNVTDNSVMDLDKRKYYVQSYDFTMLGYLIDEEEFQVKPAVSRVLELFEVDASLANAKRAEIMPPNPNEFPFNFIYTSGNTSLSDIVDYRIDLNLMGTTNVDSFDVYINGDYYGSDLDLIQLNTNDIILIEVNKETVGQEANIDFVAKLV
jgi:hypothetical protein